MEPVPFVPKNVALIAHDNWDPLEPQPHDPDVKALLRIAVLWDIAVARNRTSADFMISSPLMGSSHQRRQPGAA